MKKFLYITALFLSFQSFGQKTFEIYNFSSSTIDIAEILTKLNTSATYPMFSSKTYGFITLSPGSYVLENTTHTFRFPFDSPLSSPYITAWDRINSSNSVTSFPSDQAWVQGNNQVFYGLWFYDATGDYGNTVPLGIQTLTNWIPHPTLTIDYDCSNPAPNVWFYSIFIY
jgi:hypothetical protein